jgi:hypothetical protein
MQKPIVLIIAAALLPFAVVFVGVHLIVRLTNRNRPRQTIPVSGERERERHRMEIKQALWNAAQKGRADLPL